MPTGNFCSLVAAMAGTFMFVANTGMADARSLLASAGRPVIAGDYACWRPVGGGLANVCTTQKTLEVALAVDEVDKFQPHHVIVTIYTPNPTSTPVRCRAFSVLDDLTQNDQTALVSASQAGTSTLYLGIMDMADGGYIRCDVGVGARVNMVTWDRV